MLGAIEELDNGVVVHQVTDDDTVKSNIYCEFPWCPPDSHCFVYQRLAPEYSPNDKEYVACDFGTWQKRVIGRGSGFPSMAGGRFYYQRIGTKEQHEYVRVDLNSGAEHVWEIPTIIPATARLDISRDERYIAYNLRLSWSPQSFAIGLLDLQDGSTGIIHEDKWLCNPHHQFEPGQGRQLLVQHNRGCVFTPEGNRELLVGPEGCTLFLLEVPSGNVTRLPLGPPDTASCSGHEAWLGETGDVILTLNLQEDYDYGKGPIVTVKPGGPAREVCAPWQMNHIGSVPSGRIFCADTFEPDEIIIGSPYTNKSSVVCAAQTSYQRRPYDAHPHAYISPDLKWVVFNSDRSGGPQIYCAEIPSEVVAELERAN